MPEFKAMKFKVPNNTVGQALQKELFTMGYKWKRENLRVRTEDITFYYTTQNGEIQYGSTQEYFDRQYAEERIVVTESRLVVAELVPRREKVVVFGKTYYKDDVDAVLANLPRATL